MFRVLNNRFRNISTIALEYSWESWEVYFCVFLTWHTLTMIFIQLHELIVQRNDIPYPKFINTPPAVSG